MSEIRTEYKIRRRSDGLFSSGGGWPTWTKKGKTWKRRGDVGSHLTYAVSRRALGTYGDTPYEDIEIVTYDVVIMEVEIEEMGEAVTACRERHAAREQTRQAAAMTRRLATLDEEAARLRARLESPAAGPLR